MATSSIDICSNALLLLGDNKISAFNESAGGLVAENLYDSVLEDLLTQHHWRFATKKKQLNRISTDPINGYSYKHQLPADYLRAIGISPNGPYDIFEDELHANYNPVELDYIYKPAVAEWPPWFVKAMEYAMAAELAEAVTEQTTRAEFYQKKAEIQIAKAMGIDSQQRPNVAIKSNPFLEAHY